MRSHLILDLNDDYHFLPFKDLLQDLYTIPFKIVSTPLLDSFGKTAWDNMVRRTRTAVFNPDQFREITPEGFIQDQNRNFVHFSPDQYQKPIVITDDSFDIFKSYTEELNSDQKEYPNGAGAFSKFFQDLHRCVNKGVQIFFSKPKSSNTPEKSKPPTRKEKKKKKKCPATINIDKDDDKHLAEMRLTVIGHSMGATMLNELISFHEKMPYKNIVYLAAAASLRGVRKSVVPLLLRGPQKKENVRILKILNGEIKISERFMSNAKTIKKRFANGAPPDVLSKIENAIKTAKKKEYPDLKTEKKIRKRKHPD